MLPAVAVSRGLPVSESSDSGQYSCQFTAVCFLVFKPNNNNIWCLSCSTDDIARQRSSTEVKSDPPEKLPVSHQKLSPVALSEEINKEENQESVKPEPPTKEAEALVDKVAKRDHRPGKVLRKTISVLPPIKYKQ